MEMYVRRVRPSRGSGQVNEDRHRGRRFQGQNYSSMLLAFYLHYACLDLITDTPARLPRTEAATARESFTSTRIQL